MTLDAVDEGDRLTLTTVNPINGTRTHRVTVDETTSYTARWYDKVHVTATPTTDSDIEHYELRTRYTGGGWIEPHITGHYADGSTTPEGVVCNIDECAEVCDR